MSAQLLIHGASTLNKCTPETDSLIHLKHLFQTQEEIWVGLYYGVVTGHKYCLEHKYNLCGQGTIAELIRVKQRYYRYTLPALPLHLPLHC